MIFSDVTGLCPGPLPTTQACKPRPPQPSPPAPRSPPAPCSPRSHAASQPSSSHPSCTTRKPVSPSKKRLRRNDASDKTLPLSTLAQKKAKEKVRTPSQKRIRKDTFSADFTDKTRPKYATNKRVSPFKPLKEPILKDWEAVVKWSKTRKLDGHFMPKIYVKIASVEEDFFKILLENGKWLNDTVCITTLLLICFFI